MPLFIGDLAECDILQLGILLIEYACVMYCQSKWIKRIKFIETAASVVRLIVRGINVCRVHGQGPRQWVQAPVK